MKKTLSALIIFLFLLSSIIPVVISDNPISTKTIYVDDDNTEGPWDGSQEHPYQFIQDGINHASDGDTIFVYAGIYSNYIPENEYCFLIDKSVKLIGEDRNNTIIDGQYLEDIDIIYISADNVKIDNFTLQHSEITGYGIKINGCSNVTISNCSFYNHTLAAIQLIRSCMYIKISNCLIADSNAGIGLNEDSNNNMISNCYIDTERISLSFSSSNTIVSNCKIRNGISLFWGSNNTIINCSISDNDEGGYGIQIGYTSNNTLRNNSFNNCSIFFQCNFIYEYYHDIDSSNLINGKPIYYLIEENNFEFNETVEIGYIGLISCRNITVKNLDLYGVALANSSLCKIDNCFFENNYHGVTIDLSSNNIITNCSFSNILEPIRIFKSLNNTIANCQMPFGREYGFGVDIRYYSYDNNIMNCLINGFYYGISVSGYSNRNNISGCVVSNNKYGIDFDSKGSITGCNIYNNELGLTIYGSNNIIIGNNFFNNTYNAAASELNKWNIGNLGNYWDDWIGIRFPFLRFLPYHVSGIKNFDWHPAKEPYDIPAGGA